LKSKIPRGREFLVCGCTIDYDRAMIFLCVAHQDGNGAATQRLNQRLWGDKP
jgi:hypothetical protein